MGERASTQGECVRGCGFSNRCLSTGVGGMRGRFFNGTLCEDREYNE